MGEFESKVNYQQYYLTATTDQQSLTISRISERINIENSGDGTLNVVLQTQEDNTADFSSTNKMIRIRPNEYFEEDMDVNAVIYKVESGVTAIGVFIDY